MTLSADIAATLPRLKALELDASARVHWQVNPAFDKTTLSPAVRACYDRLLAEATSPHGDYNWWSNTRFSGDLYTAARPIWFTAAGILAGFLATGSGELLDLFDSLVGRVIGFMSNRDSDPYDELVYTTGVVSSLLIGTDNGQDFNLLASWLTFAAFVLNGNRGLKTSYAAHVDFIENWLFNHYLAELIAEGQNAPAAPDDVMHCWTRGALWLHTLERLWGFRQYSERLTTIKNLVVRDTLKQTFIEQPNGSLVWDHRPYGRGTLGAQPSVYAGDTVISLFYLALTGGLPLDWLPKIAKTISLNMFPAATFPGTLSVSGVPPLPGSSAYGQQPYNEPKYRLVGYAGFAAWDNSGVIAALNEQARLVNVGDAGLAGWMVFATAVRQRVYGG